MKTLNDNLENDGISQKKMKYYYNLKTVTDKLQKYPEMQHITSMDVTDLEQHSVKKLRILAQCLGITKPNIITSKEELIHSIDTVYRSIERFEEETDDDEETKETENIVASPSPSLHEQRVQRALNIGEPLSYDSDEYYDLVSLQELYADYSVHFFRKNDKTCLSVKSMDIFFTRALLLLFLKHYRCFKNINRQWYRYTNETERWETVNVYDIENFVFQVYERIESIARLIDKELSRAFVEMNDNVQQGKYVVTRNASIALQKCIKTCS